MAKGKRVKSSSSLHSRSSPYPRSSKDSKLDKPSSPLPSDGDIKEWEEARCPICLEHPHNAVLLMCSSRGNGCRPYMCNTSHRHSNCFDQYYKLAQSSPSSLVLQENPSAGPTIHGTTDGQPLVGQTMTNESKWQPKLSCPLCRGDVHGWIVVDRARGFMNSKRRSCSCENCEFSGNYSELRKHARSAHPSIRPSEADPVRQQDWTEMEFQNNINDLLAMVMGGTEAGEVSDARPSESGGHFSVAGVSFLMVPLIVYNIHQVPLSVGEEEHREEEEEEEVNLESGSSEDALLDVYNSIPSGSVISSLQFLDIFGSGYEGNEEEEDMGFGSLADAHQLMHNSIASGSRFSQFPTMTGRGTYGNMLSGGYDMGTSHATGQNNWFGQNNHFRSNSLMPGNNYFTRNFSSSWNNNFMPSNNYFTRNFSSSWNDNFMGNLSGTSTPRRQNNNDLSLINVRDNLPGTSRHRRLNNNYLSRIDVRDNLAGTSTHRRLNNNDLSQINFRDNLAGTSTRRNDLSQINFSGNLSERSTRRRLNNNDLSQINFRRINRQWPRWPGSNNGL